MSIHHKNLQYTTRITALFTKRILYTGMESTTLGYDRMKELKKFDESKIVLNANVSLNNIYLVGGKKYKSCKFFNQTTSINMRIWKKWEMRIHLADELNRVVYCRA